MHWLPIAFVTALSFSTADALSKKALRDTDDLVIAWVRQGYALPFLAIGFLFVPVPRLDLKFWLSIASLIPLEIGALLLYLRAIRISPLSLTVPFLALSPVFIIITAFILLGEWPSRYGMTGIFLIAFGAYLLNARTTKTGVLEPFRAVLKERGSLLMIGVALIYSVTSSLGKVAIEHSSPIFFGFFYPLILTGVLTVFITATGRGRMVFSRPKMFLPIGLATATMIFTHYLALSMTQVAYMISVKRTSLIFSVIYGKLVFKEIDIRERLLGSAIMVAGVALIALF